MSEILVYIEQIAGEITDVSLQCLTKGRELAQKNNSKLNAIIIGRAGKSITEALPAFGADKVFLAENDHLKSYLASPYTKVFLEVIKQLSPELILIPGSTQGNDLASAVSAKLGGACVLDCKDILLEGDKYIAKRVEFDNKVQTSFQAKDDKMFFVTCKDGIIDAGKAENPRELNTAVLDVNIDDVAALSKLIRHELAKKTVNLKAAKIIVTAGAGIGSKDNFKLIEDFAKAIGAEVGATRPVVDAGWASADRQVGQTGTTVKPDLYIACGVSGAVQHRVGMMDSKTIVAINTDSSAPIFKIANYIIIGDLNVVIPKLIKLI